MDQHLVTDAAEEPLLQNLQRRYASLAAWLVRFNRPPEPGRLPEPVRLSVPPRTPLPPRQPHPPRPE